MKTTKTDPSIFPVVPVAVGTAVKESRIFVEIIPCALADVVGKAFEHVPDLRGAVNDARGYESLYDAIINAERVGSRLLSYVPAENLLFVFGETVQALNDFPLVLPDDEIPPRPIEEPGANSRRNNRRGEKQNQPQDKAVVLCKVEDAKALKEILASKEKQGRNATRRYEIAWGELQELKRQLSDTFDH